jgi:lipopolysaccharide transport system ATP-binding protein
MSKTQRLAVQLTDVSKNYIVYAKPKYWLADFMGFAHFLKENKHYRSFWALRDINLEIPGGERVAVIGRNGAGKSTLLRIISGNIATTTGIVKVSGRSEALLELGTGFNPQFTGRENIFTALAYKGVTGKAAEEKFWEIVDFSELDEFIDQPVNTYSSGMYLRLAFALSTAIIPEILIIDEILSAGDMYFQGKCLARMQELTSGPGVTVLFVSHDMNAAKRLCDTFVWIERGRIAAMGPSDEVVALYEDSIRKQQEVKLRARNLRLQKKTISALQHAGEEGFHLFGRFVLETDAPKATGPDIFSIRLFVRDKLHEEILVGDSMDDNFTAYPSFVISDPAEGTWSAAKKINNRFCRSVMPGRNGTDGASFALFLPADNFTAEDYHMKIEVVYRDCSPYPCHIELHAGVAGLKRIHTFEHSDDYNIKIEKFLVPRWVYAIPKKMDEHNNEQKSIEDKMNIYEENASDSPTEVFKGENLTSLIERNEDTIKRFGTHQVIIEKIQFINERGEESCILQHGKAFSIVLSYKTCDLSLIGSTMGWSMSFLRPDGVNTIQMISLIQGKKFEIKHKGKLSMNFDNLLLNSGIYKINTAIFSDLDLNGPNTPFTESKNMYDVLRGLYEVAVNGTTLLESGLVRHPVKWDVID